MFKSIDKRFLELGFAKGEESDGVLEYIRYNNQYNFTHIISIIHKHNGNHLIQSYEEEVNSDGYNNVVGLSKEETKLALKAMKNKFKK